MICTRKLFYILLLALVAPGRIFASHMMGGMLSYTFIDSARTGFYHYKITLTLYQDCLTGQPEAIAQDNPANITIYQRGFTVPSFVDEIRYVSSLSSKLSAEYTTPCGIVSPPDNGFCGLKKVFEKDYYLPRYSQGYDVAFQRCCRTSALVNILNAGDAGATYFCHIPPINVTNTSARYSQDPPFVVCTGNNLVYDLSATDADGDSLSYELSPGYGGARDNDIKPITAMYPPYDTLHYISGFSFSNPMGNGIFNYNPLTGRLNIKADRDGRYLAGVICKEWRNGVLINTNIIEFNCLAVSCSEGIYAGLHPHAGNDTIIFTGDSIHFNATGGTSFEWSPATHLNSTTISDPIGIFTNPGIITYVVTAVNDSGCTGRDTIQVNVIDHPCFVVPTGFSPNGDRINDWLFPFPLKDAVLKSFRIYNRYGNLVFSTSSGDAWDGKFHDKEQPMGVYAWQIEYDDGGTLRVQSGNVTLLR